MIKRFILGVAACMLLLGAGTLPASAADNGDTGNIINQGSSDLGTPNSSDTGNIGMAGAGCGNNTPTGVAAFLNFKSWDAYLCKDAHGVPQFTAVDDIWKVALVVIDFIARVSGYLAVGFIIWGGVKYLKSQGEPSETGAARQIITNALMGLVICIISVAIVQFIAGAF